MVNDYVKNADVGFGHLKKTNYGKCRELNSRLSEAIACFELDNMFMLVRLLKEKHCRLSRKNQKFLNRFEDN